MNRFGLAVLVGLGFCQAAARAADATSPVDYTQRNTPFNPGTTIVPEKHAPVRQETVQQKRVTPDVIEKKPADVADRRAPVTVSEDEAKNVREKDSHRPDVVEQPKSRYDQKRAPMSTSADTTKPPMVAKYQDSLVAASASNMARFPAIGGATGAKINRFVFRKNGGELADAAPRGVVTPAAGGSALKK